MALQLTYLFETEEELRAHLGITDIRAAAPAPAPAAPTPDNDETDDEPSRDDVDADGMPYNAAVHSDPPKFTAAGLWKAQRGKADEAKAARDAFKAGGAGVAAPDRAETPPADVSNDLPSLPGGATLPPPAPAPVEWNQFVAKITEHMGAGRIDLDGLRAFYVKHTGVSGTNDEIVAGAGAILKTNETVRAAAYADLVAMESQ